MSGVTVCVVLCMHVTFFKIHSLMNVTLNTAVQS